MKIALNKIFPRFDSILGDKKISAHKSDANTLVCSGLEALSLFFPFHGIVDSSCTDQY